MKQIISAAILIVVFCLPIFAQANENLCPKISIVTPKESISRGESVDFLVNVGANIEKLNVSYEWTISAGRIVKGQGTSKIEFVVDDTDTANVYVAVEIIGLPKGCADSSTETVPVTPHVDIEPLDSYGNLSRNDETARLQNFFYNLSQEKSWEGVIILQFDKKTSASKRIKRMNRIIKSIEFLKCDVSRITFVILEEDYERTTFFALTENGKFFKDLIQAYKTIKAEEFKQKIKELFPKK